MAEFEIPDLNVMSVTSVDTVSTSGGNELPFIPFSNSGDELGFGSFN